MTSPIHRVLACALVCLSLGCQGSSPAAPAQAEEPATPAAPPAAAEPTTAVQAKPEPTQAVAAQPSMPAATQPSTDSATICSQLCAHSTALRCSGAAGCQAACLQMFAEPLCPAAFDAFTACALREPTAHFECGDEGVAALMDGYCVAEQRAFAQCAQAEVLGQQ